MMRRVWRDGHSKLVVERGIDGRIRISVDDIDDPGYAVTFSPAASTEIAEFIKEGA